MKPDISEFSYGYALTENLIKAANAKMAAAPVFPSLIQEGKIGGYDVSLGYGSFCLFLQFKLSDHMISRRAIECQKGLLNLPYYRFHLRSKRRSAQHDLLLELEKSGELVFYAAPAFTRVNELDDAYLSEEVVARSVFVRPSEIREINDDDDHHVAFSVQAGQCKAFLFSEPVPIDIFRGSEFTKFLNNYRPNQWGDSGVHQELVSLLQRHSLITGSQAERYYSAEIPSVRMAAYLSSVYLGCQLYVITPN